jgi:heat shock protein HtpX
MGLTNRLKTVVLLSALTALFLWIGRALGGQGGLMIALVFAALMNIGAYWFSDKIVLAMYRAKPVTPLQEPELYSVVEQLAQQNGMPMPKVYIIPEQTPNAFATGRNPDNAAVAVTVGLMELLDRRELKGVLSHELGHVKNRDTLISAVAATLAGALSMLADMAMWGSMLGGRSNDREGGNPLAGLVGIILAPIAGVLIQSAISRSREFLADQAGAHTTGDPLALASALLKIESVARRLPMRQGHPATAHLFIINPFRGQSLLQLFSTHPPTRERVARLEAMAQSAVGIY